MFEVVESMERRLGKDPDSILYSRGGVQLQQPQIERGDNAIDGHRRFGLFNITDRVAALLYAIVLS